jgi:arabinose-5-phosphate isomerase
MEKYLAEASELMRLQAKAITDAADRLDLGAFGRAVELLSEPTGKVVVSGAGTSGVIARKIAATLTSTGTAAVFLHPADALHGGLGIVSAEDVAILVSNSGETDELLVLVPYLQHRKVPVIAIIGNARSTLARYAEVTLDAFARREACPLNLAPTASTSVALAVGDALAMTVMQVKGLTPERFALNHPSGRLGKRLVLKVDDVMHAGPTRPVVLPESSWLEVVGGISQGGLGAATVEDGEGFLLGIITDGDLRRTVELVEASRLGELRAKDIMAPQPVSVSAGRLAYEALELMENRPSQLSVLPVVDASDRCLGLVRLHDLVRSGI